MDLALNNLQWLRCHKTKFKMNVLAQLELKITYSKAAVQHFSHNVPGGFKFCVVNN